MPQVIACDDVAICSLEEAVDALVALDFDPVSYTHLTLPTNREV